MIYLSILTYSVKVSEYITDNQLENQSVSQQDSLADSLAPARLKLATSKTAKIGSQPA